MDIYHANFAALLALCAGLFAAQYKPPASKQKSSDDSSAHLKENRNNQATHSPEASQHSFLLVYALVMAADWLQGPYLYSLYTEEHRVSPSLVSALFTTGFLAAAAAGSFVGSLADRRGRKAACLFCCAACALSCAATAAPSGSAPILFVGRVLGGVSTSLLFSVFESWMVTDFHSRGLAGKGGDLSRMFGRMSTLNSVVAVGSGVVSEWLVSATGTRKTPFAASVLLLGVAFWLIAAQWDENYGDTGDKKAKAKDQDKQTTSDSKLWTTLTNPQVLALGVASTMFEGSMYLFVFFWTPALKSAQTTTSQLPYGLIFASFMASALAASLAFNIIAEWQAVRYSTLLVAILATADFCFFSSIHPKSEQATFWVFCLFEATVGMYWPCTGYLKGKLVEDGMRAQVYSIMRIPLNLFVVAVLLYTGDGEASRSVFSLCSKLLLGACGALGLSLLNSGAP